VRIAEGFRRRTGTLAAIAIGGAAGTLARVELARVIPAGPGVPWETLTVNVSGAFVLGILATLLVERLGPARHLGPLLATGFCGSFTTFSTLAVEVDLRLRSGDVLPGLGYGVISLVAGLAAIIVGAAMARALAGREAGTADRPPGRRQWN
jgi:CrcB protein